MLKKVPSFVLASLKASTYRPRDKEPVSAGSGRAGEMVRLGFEDTAGSRRHGPLTISRASTHVTRLIRRVVDLASAHKHAAPLFVVAGALLRPRRERRVLARRGWVGENDGLLNILVALLLSRPPI